MSSMNRRRLLTSATTGAAGLAVAAAASTTFTAPAVVHAQEVQKVRALIWSNGPVIDGHFEDRLKKFNEAHKDTVEINLEFLPYDQYWQKLQLAYASGDIYDVYFWDVQAYGHYKKGLLLDVQPMIDKAGLFKPEEYPTAMFDPWRFDGKNLFGVPENFQTIALFYNKDLFDAAGVSYPDDTWTYDQVVDAAMKMTIRRGDRVTQWGMSSGVLGIWWGLQSLSWAQGDAFFDKVLEPTKFQFENPANVESLDFIRALVNDHKIAPSPALASQSSDTTGFQSGLVGLVPDGSWNISGFAELPFNWGVTAIPKFHDNRVVPYFMGGWVIAKATKVPDGAFEWARWSASDFQQDMAGQQDWIPVQNAARASSATTDGLPDGYRAVIDSLESAKIGDVYSDNTQQIWVEVFDPNLQKLLNENTPAADVAKALDEGANKLLQG